MASGLGASLISFSPNTLIKSHDVNTNFTNLNNAPVFNGTVHGNADTATNSTNASNLKNSGGSTGASVDNGGNVTFNNNPKDGAGNQFAATVKASGTGTPGGVLISTGWLPSSQSPNWQGVEPVGTTLASWCIQGSGTPGSVMVYTSATVGFSLLSTNAFAHS